MKLIAAALILLSFVSCESADPVPAVQRIDFGHWGGIIDAGTVYTLNANGQLTGEHRQNSPPPATVIRFLTKTIDPITTMRLMSRASVLFPYNYNEGGNPGSFMWIRASGSDKYIGWQDSQALDSRVLELNEDLKKLLK